MRCYLLRAIIRRFISSAFSRLAPAAYVMKPRPMNEKWSTSSRSNNTVNSTWWLRNGSFLRLKTVEMGYSLPAKFTKKLGFEVIRFFASGNNLFCISDFKLWDPEMGGYGIGYPTQRVYNVGLNVEF